MDDTTLPKLGLAADCEVVELVYRLAKGAEAHVDLTVTAGGSQRKLRFLGPRVVQIAEEMPEGLRGVELSDVRAQNLGALALWVSVGSGAVTFWAKDVIELSSRRTERGAPEARPELTDTDDRRGLRWHETPGTGFTYRAPRASSALRHFSVSMRPFSH